MKGAFYNENYHKITVQNCRASLCSGVLPVKPCNEILCVGFWADLRAPVPAVCRGRHDCSIQRGHRANSQYCFFCGRADKGIRFKKPQDYVSELRYLSSIQTTKYIFEIGDDFLQDYCWISEVADLLSKNPIRDDVHLKIFSRANRITPDVIPILKKLNIDEVAIGFESGSEKILNNINKKASPEDNMNAAKLMFENGIDTIASFVLGLPGEDEVSLQETYVQAIKIRELALKHLGKIPQEIIANMIEINPGAPAFKKLCNHYSKKYACKDDLDVYETQNDYFKMEFNLKNDFELTSFRQRLVYWGNKINQLGSYTYLSMI